MIAQKHPELEVATGVGLPNFEMFAGHSDVADAAKCGQIAFEWRLIHVLVGLSNREIGAQDWNHHLEQLRMIEHFRRCAVQTSQLVDEFCFGQLKRSPLCVSCLCRTMP